MAIVTLVTAVFVAGTVLSLSGCNSQDAPQSAQPSAQSAVSGARPRLLDLGATKCIPCKKMAPILEELKAEYEGTLDVEFVDVWKMPGVAKQYGVESIPTQIFFDASGKELYRHEGFFAKEDILQKWNELGVNLKK
jgi:thioredoxin 1